MIAAYIQWLSMKCTNLLKTLRWKFQAKTFSEMIKMEKEGVYNIKTYFNIVRHNLSNTNIEWFQLKVHYALAQVKMLCLSLFIIGWFLFFFQKGWHSLTGRAWTLSSGELTDRIMKASWMTENCIFCLKPVPPKIVRKLTVKNKKSNYVLRKDQMLCLWMLLY